MKKLAKTKSNTLKQKPNIKAKGKTKPKRSSKRANIDIKPCSGLYSFCRWLWGKGLVAKLFFLFLLGLFAVLIFVLWCLITLPAIDSSKALSRKPIIRIFDSSGELISSYGDMYGEAISLKELPSYVPEAVLAIEDRRFYAHPGFDIRGIARAFFVNILSWGKAQGASTITQQVAKNLFLSSEKTIKRKVQEALLTVWLEYSLSKEQILTLYLNRVYLGAGTYGIDAASKRYFDRPASKLTLYQAAQLAGLLKAPSRYNPNYSLASEQRAKLVLAKMVENGFISAKEEKRALLSLNNANLVKKTKSSNSRYFSDWVLKNAEAYLGVIDKDINIKTSFDLNVQKILEKALLNNIPKDSNVKAGAGIVMNFSGAVLAMSGGFDYNKSQFNRATDARRQPASTIKPFIYLTAFEEGYTAKDIINDSPVVLDKWTPKNLGGKFYGEITLEDGLVRSLNTVPVILTQEIGLAKVVNVLRRFGLLHKKCDENLSLSLGTCEVSLLKLTGAYASLASGGFPVIPHAIEEIRDEEGNILYQRHSDGRGRIASRKSVSMLNDILAKVISEGTGKRAFTSLSPLNISIYGKTGTSQNNRDAWFIGFTEDIVAGIWLGNDDETPMSGVYGGNLPAHIWSDIIEAITTRQ